MKFHDPNTRLQRSLTTAGILAVAGYAYTLVASNVLDVERHRYTPRKETTTTEEPADLGDEDVLAWLGPDSWVSNSRYSLRDGNRYLHCNRIAKEDHDDSKSPADTTLFGQPEGAGQTFMISPLAIVWKSERPDEQPVVVTSEGASVSLSQRLSMSTSAAERHETSIRVVSGTLKKNVTIQGPKNLHITGREFFINETSMKLWSRDPVQFRWEGHEGTADGGIEVQLNQLSPDDRGLTTISGIGIIRLNGKVVCDLFFPAKRPDDEDVRLTVTAADRFEFDMQENRGRFFGLPGRSYTRENQVLVTRPTDGKPDRLLCPQLTVEFHPEIDPNTGEANNNRLRLGFVSATGKPEQPVIYSAAEYHIIARLHRLTYQVEAGQLDLYGLGNGPRDGSSTKHFVVVKQFEAVDETTREVNQLLVPHLRVLHSRDSTIERLELHGRGEVRRTDRAESEPRRSAVSWDHRLVAQRRPDGLSHTIEIDNGGRISLLNEGQMALRAETIHLTVLSEEADVQNGQRGQLSLDLENAQPKTLVATGDVIVNSPAAAGKISDTLTIHFEQRSAQTSVTSVSHTQEVTGSAAFGEAKPETAGRSQFFGEVLTATVSIDSGREDSEAKWETVRLTGPEARVDYHGARSDQSFTAHGTTFIASNGIGNHAVINILGNPATIKSATGRASGRRIDLDQSAGTAEINNNGELEIVIDQDMDGTPIPPLPMTVLWSGRMLVEGRTATFTENVRVVLEGVRYNGDDEEVHDSTIRAPELTVHFASPINLSGSGQDRRLTTAAGTQATPDIDHLHFVGRTVLHQESFLEKEQSRVTDAEMVDLRLWPSSGRVTAQGSGLIESTFQRDGSGLQPESGVTVGVNAPASRNGPGWTNLKVSFVGRLEGNISQQNFSLHKSVHVTSAHVPDITTKIDLQQIPTEEFPEKSGFLRADHVYVESVAGEDGESFSITAKNNAIVETRDLSGNADTIVFDSSKQQYHLSATDGRNIKARGRIRGTGSFQEFNGDHARYNARTGSFGGQFLDSSL